VDSSFREHQMNYIMNQLSPRMDGLNAIKDNNQRMASLTYEMWAMVEEYMNDIANTDWMNNAHSKMFTLGGVMINTDGDMTDLFLPLRFGYKTSNGKYVDLMQETFGPQIGAYAVEVAPLPGQKTVTSAVPYESP